MARKTLNFFPFYEDLLKSKRKTTTLRLRNLPGLQAGDEVAITTGWDESRATGVGRGLIREVSRRRVRDLTPLDLEGESPDCTSPEAVRFVLSCIYRTVVDLNDEVWVVKFDYIG